MKSKIEAECETKVGTVRHHVWERHHYIIRDLVRVHPTGFIPSRLLGREYATRNVLGETVWTRCAKGVKFANIRPFETAVEMVAAEEAHLRTLQHADFLFYRSARTGPAPGKEGLQETAAWRSMHTREHLFALIDRATEWSARRGERAI